MAQRGEVGQCECCRSAQQSAVPSALVQLCGFACKGPQPSHTENSRVEPSFTTARPGLQHHYRIGTEQVRRSSTRRWARRPSGGHGGVQRPPTSTTRTPEPRSRSRTRSMVSFSFSFSFMPHATQRGHGFCVRVARSCVQTRLCVIRTCDRPFRGLRTRVPRKRRRHKWACAAIRLLRCYAALRTAGGARDGIRYWAAGLRLRNTHQKQEDRAALCAGEQPDHQAPGVAAPP